MSFYTFFTLRFILYKNKSFIWESKKNRFKVIKIITSININLLTGIDKQKKSVLNNTINFAKGNFTNNVLLWGTRGNGKSTLIKSIFNFVSKDYTPLRLIQLNKNNIVGCNSQKKNSKSVLLLDGFRTTDFSHKASQSC